MKIDKILKKKFITPNGTILKPIKVVNGHCNEPAIECKAIHKVDGKCINLDGEVCKDSVNCRTHHDANEAYEAFTSWIDQ